MWGCLGHFILGLARGHESILQSDAFAVAKRSLFIVAKAQTPSTRREALEAANKVQVLMSIICRGHLTFRQWLLA